MTSRFTISFVSLLLMVVTCLFSCRRETGFGKIKVEGKVVDFVTKQPIANQKVSMYAKRWYNGKEGGDTFLGETTTDGNGNFKLHTTTARTHEYRLYYGGGAYMNRGDTSFSTKKIKIDIGTVFSGTHSTVFQVHLKPVSGNCLWTIDKNSNTIKINSGTDTNLFYTRTIDYFSTKLQQTIFVFKYRIDQCVNSNTTLTNSYGFPFAISDTLKTDFNY